MLDSKADTRWVLIAEDDDDIRQIFRDTLLHEPDGLNIELVEARDGIEALAKVNGREFHCVLTDVRMPRASGLDLIRAMQQTPLNAHTPKLVITAAPITELGALASHIRVVPKPFIASDVVRMVVRELRLGRMDDRAAVHLINPFAEAIEEFVREELKQECKIDAPSVQRQGEDLPGDIHCNLVIASGHMRHRFTLSFDQRLLKALKSEYFQGRTASHASLTHEKVAKQLCQLFHEKAATKMQAILGAAPVLSGNSFVTRDQTAAYASMCNTTGIKVIFNTANGRLIAGAYSKARHRRV